MDLCFVHINQATQPTPYGELTVPILQQLSDIFAAYMQEDIAPVWGGTYESRPGSAPDDVGVGECAVRYVDNLDSVPGAAAYHDRDENGNPIIYVALSQFTDFFKGSMAVSSGSCHEGGETGVDPGANRWADRADGTEEALEVCDRLEGTDYEKNGAMVPNFLYPEAFDPGAPGPYDKQGVLTTVDGLTPGGYVILRYQGVEAAPAAKAPGVALCLVKKVKIEGLATPLHPLTLARKLHHSSRSYRRGARF